MRNTRPQVMLVLLGLLLVVALGVALFQSVRSQQTARSRLDSSQTAVPPLDSNATAVPGAVEVRAVQEGSREKTLRVISIQQTARGNLAVIMHRSTRDVAVLAPGELAFGGARLKTIDTDKVTFELDGTLVTLPLEPLAGQVPSTGLQFGEDEENAGNQSDHLLSKDPSRRTSPRPSKNLYSGGDVWNLLVDPVPLIKDRAAPLQGLDAPNHDEDYHQDQNEMQVYHFEESEVRRIVPHLGLFLADAEPQIVFENDKIMGLKLGRIAEGQFLQQAGLRPGDIIEQVDFRKVIDPYDIVQAIATNRSDTVGIKVLRDDSEGMAARKRIVIKLRTVRLAK